MTKSIFEKEVVRTIRLSELDEITKFLVDTKKVVSYDVGSGTWYWVERGCEDELSNYHNGFETWLYAAKDAVKPYMEASC